MPLIFTATILGSAINAKAWSGYFDSLTGHKIRNTSLTYIAEWNVGSPVSEYPDFLAFGLSWVFVIVVASGAQCTAKFTSVMSSLSVLVLLFVTVSGFSLADTSNWTSNSTGGFLPYGWHGVLAATGNCFWALTGFETVAVSNEEAKNPEKTVPIATLLAILVVTLLYIGTASGLTLMTSYLNLDSVAPLPSVFVNTKIPWGQYIAAVGPLFGITTILVTNLYSYSRLLYAISSDGLLPEVFGRVNSYTNVPLLGVFTGGAVMSVLALFLDLRDLITFGVNIQAIHYILVCACVVILRYRPLILESNPLSTTTEAIRKQDLLNNDQQLNSEKTVRSESESECKQAEYIPVSNEEKKLLFDDRNIGEKRAAECEERRNAAEAGKLKSSFSCLGLLWLPPPGNYLGYRAFIFI